MDKNIFDLLKNSQAIKEQAEKLKAEKDKGKDKFYLNDSLNREVKTKQEMKIEEPKKQEIIEQPKVEQKEIKTSNKTLQF